MESSQFSTPPSNIFLFLSTPEKYIGQSRPPKIPHCSALPPPVYLVPVEKQAVLPPILPVTQVRDDDSAKSSFCFPRAHISTHRPTLSWGPPIAHHTSEVPAHSSGTWETRSPFLKLEEFYNPVISYWLTGQGRTEFIIFWPSFLNSFQTNRRTCHHRDSLMRLIYSYNRLLFKECIKISK